MFNPVAPYRYRLLTGYLFTVDIANTDLFVCCCRTWICLDITRLYEEQRQPSSGSAWPACPKTENQLAKTAVTALLLLGSVVCNHKPVLSDSVALVHRSVKLHHVYWGRCVILWHRHLGLGVPFCYYHV